ncbi:MAG TPA: UpxY family transcription antiterminator [Candidatus Dormibacteraeota bacterium]|nr:UpxY family transcription antiterminator [Candidatus Dormibacteraeota bacterium]
MIETKILISDCSCGQGGEAVTEGESMELIAAIPETLEPGLAPELAEQNWYAVYTWAHHEKRVAEMMSQRKIRGFLPVYRSLRRWKDRRKEIELALFPSYVFVYLALRDRVRVLEIPGVVDMVGARGKPTPLAEQEIACFQRGMDGCVKLHPHPFLKIGRKVRVRYGSLAGLEGILIRRKDGPRLVVSIEILMRSVAVEVDETDVEPCP